MSVVRFGNPTVSCLDRANPSPPNPPNKFEAIVKSPMSIVSDYAEHYKSTRFVECSVLSFRRAFRLAGFEGERAACLSDAVGPACY